MFSEKMIIEKNKKKTNSIITCTLFLWKTRRKIVLKINIYIFCLKTTRRKLLMYKRYFALKM